MACLSPLVEHLTIQAIHLDQGKADASKMGGGLFLPPTLVGLAVGPTPRPSALQFAGGGAGATLR